MPYSITFPVILLAACCALAFILASQALKQQLRAEMLPLGWFLSNAATWCGAYAFELFNLDPTLQGVAVGIKYIGVTLAPAFWLVFVLVYARGQSVLRWMGALLLAPLAELLLAWTNGFHHLFWQGNLATGEGAPGPAFWLLTIYNLLMLLAALAVLGWHLRRPRRKVTLLLLLAAALPWAAGPLQSGLFSFVLTFNPTPALLVISGLLAWIGMRYWMPERDEAAAAVA